MMNQKELSQRIKGLRGNARKQAICGLVGHSHLTTFFFGYHYCARCEDQIGDSLGSTYNEAGNNVIIDHNCKTCNENKKKLTWKDKIGIPSIVKNQSL